MNTEKEAKVRILHLEAGKKLYGGAKQVTLLIEGLATTSYQHYLACPKGSAIANFPFQNCEVLPIKMGGDLDISIVVKLVKIINANNIDILHIHSRRGADLWGPLAAKWAGIPVVSTRRVDNIETKILGRLKFPKWVNTVAISKGVAKALQQFTPAQNVPVIHSAVEPQFFNLARNREALNTRYALPDDGTIIGCFAQLIPRKGQALLIDAMARLTKQHKNLYCILFGKGKCLQTYKTQIEQLGLEKQVMLAGFVDDIDKVLPVVDIVAHPALAEGLGVILLQASACERPIISTSVGGIPEIIIDQQTGLLIEPNNVNALINAIQDYLNNPRKAHQHGENAKTHVETHFSVKAMCESYATIYGQLTKNKNTNPPN